ncbi:MAG: O-antigen ligase family protein [bacterium]|nr:O-antigen ligase family protein [bacterium]
MKKVLSRVWDNILFVSTLFLLAFIPLYPKLPLFDIVNTWVYIRVEDFVVLFVLLFWIIHLFQRKITLKTPLTLPIIIFWIIGAIATIHGVLLIFPTVANIYPNVAFLSFLRRIEYVSLFFIGFSAMRSKRLLPYVIFVLAATLLLVFAYGLGQKYFGFPAFLTMNEEFAKGVPIQLSRLSRVPSTFAGHYDLAGYLVLIIPILASLIFGLRNWLVRILLFLTIMSGVVLLFMTVSRVSFFVLLVSLVGVLIMHKKRFIIFSLPVIALVLIFLSLRFTPALFDRFGNTIKKIDVLVDAKTGESLGHVRIVPSSYFENKVVKRKFFQGRDQLDSLIVEDEQDRAASVSSVIPFTKLPKTIVLVSPPNTPTGENLPQGTGYINLSLSPVVTRAGEFLYEGRPDSPVKDVAFMFQGDFLIKRASAYDLSFTTRYQGEWPMAIEAFKKNIFFGSGYSSISLAVDNNYLRILGETGLLGFISFFAIFLGAAIYIKKTLPRVDSPLIRSFVLGFSAGVIGLMLNAILIDVFDASKIAYLLWILTGITIGSLYFYQEKEINLLQEFRKAATSTYAIILYLGVLVITLLSPMISNYFIGDDFTWFRWAADCGSGNCPFVLKTIAKYFTEADGFFWRPGTKIYFLGMYSMFWLNQAVYHFVSLLLHFIVAGLLYLLANKIMKSILFSALAALLFLILSGYSEAVFWISSTGYLFNAIFILLSLLFFIQWEEKKKNIYFVLSFSSFVLSLLFHELGVVTPLLIILYKFVNEPDFSFSNLLKKIQYPLMLLPILTYLFLRFIAGSHWSGGDYSYNLLKLPFNFIGNTIGYFFLTALGPAWLPLYETFRNISRQNLSVAVVATFLALGLVVFAIKIITKNGLIKKIEAGDKKVIIFGSLFFVIALLPFLGLGNIASRYSYLASGGFILLFVLFIKKLYEYLLSYGRDIALASITALISIFFLMHIIQIQGIHNDWYQAGEKVRKFFVSTDNLYADYWTKEPGEFYFVNVPVKKGNAWIFPVGLEDALWFPTQNDKLKVYTTSDLNFALSQAQKSTSARVFQFQDDGSFEEIIPVRKTPFTNTE